MALSFTAVLITIPTAATAQSRFGGELIAGGEAYYLVASGHAGVEGGLVLRSLGVFAPVVGGVYLSGEDARLGALALGAGVPLSLGRLSVRPFGNFLIGRLETMADEGGYHTVNGAYHPYWRPVSASAAGGAAGVALGWAIRPGLTLEGRGKYLATGKRAGWLGSNGFYGGLGLRYAWRR